MPKVKLSPELSFTIKTLRQKSNIKSTELAEHINKSVAYISKLENFNLKSLDLDLLIQIFKFLLKTEDEFQKFIDTEFNKLSIQLTPKEIKEQNWLTLFDLELRKIPIPDSLKDFITLKLKELSLTTTELIHKINQNIDLSDEDLNKIKHHNRVYIKNLNNIDRISIKFQLANTLLDDILSNKITSINFITMQGIIYNIFRLEGLDSSISLEKTKSILIQYNFLSLQLKQELCSNNLITESLNSYLSDYDQANLKYIEEIIQYIQTLSTWDIAYVNTKLEEILKTFSFNPSFALALFGLKYSQLSHLDINDSKSFLKDINKLITQYSSITYDVSLEFENFDI